MGGTPTYVWVDGCRLAPNVAYWLGRMAADFKAEFGLDLLCSSGKRTTEEQTQIFLARYVLAGDVNGRKVYDTRWWNGRLWFRISDAGTVAAPETSLHESDRAVDIRDSGADAGVTRAGNIRSNWIRANAHKYGFLPNGYNFGEPWHLEFQWDPWFVRKPVPKPVPKPTPQEDEVAIRARSKKTGHWYVIFEHTYTLIRSGKRGSANHLRAAAYSRAMGTNFPVLESADIQSMLDDTKLRATTFFNAMGQSEHAQLLAASIDLLIREEQTSPQTTDIEE